MTGNDGGDSMRPPAPPRRIVLAALTLGLLAVAIAAYTVISSVSLIMTPDPMLGLELVAAAIVLVAAAGLGAVAIALLHGARWARPSAIGGALLLGLAGVAMPFMTPRPVAAGGWPIDPLGAGVAGIGVILLVLLAKPYSRR